jgi:hypothetical protein
MKEMIIVPHLEAHTRLLMKDHMVGTRNPEQVLFLKEILPCCKLELCVLLSSKVLRSLLTQMASLK